jgi:DNA-binding winged helix-turn-helix (wHTH) protein/tetratricopeptide (TPR) repeat protein
MASPSYEFGPFRLDPAKRLLVREGHAIALTPKAFDALLILIESPERVISKDELIERLWPDTIVEESSLTQHIFLLRKALSGSDASPEYIATIPRKGYRFAEPVTIVSPEVTTPPSATHIVRYRWRWISAGAVLLLMTSVGLFLYLPQAPVLTDRDDILLADFVNSTGDMAFDGVLGQALAVHLDQSPFLRIISKERVNETLAFMKRPNEPVAGPLAREVCERLGAKASLAGTISKVGTSYIVGLEATSCVSGEVLARDQVEVKTIEQVLDGLRQAATRVRRTLGESLTSIQRFDVPIQQATTGSLEALKAFSAGEDHRAKGLEVEAIPFYKQAIELDPDFALAYARLSTVYGNQGEWRQADEYVKEAFERRDRVSEREKLYIAATYYVTGPGDMKGYRDALSLWEQAYPRDWYPRYAMADYYNGVADYERALEPAQQALLLNPDHAFPYQRLAEVYLGLNRFMDAKAILHSAVDRHRDDAIVHEELFEIAFVEQDTAAMESQVSWATRNGQESSLLESRAEAATSEGRLGEARELLQRAESLTGSSEFKQGAAELHSQRAVLEAICGNKHHAREAVKVARPIAMEQRSGIALGNLAEALALIGDVREAEAIRREKAALGSPGDWLGPGVITTEANLEIDRGRPSRAIDLLRPLGPQELGLYQGFRPIYVRGLAYLAMHDGARAAAEFQKILDHRGVAPVSPLYSLAQLQQARAWVIAGDALKSRNGYERFLAMWQGADPDVPALLDANREYAIIK